MATKSKPAAKKPAAKKLAAKKTAAKPALKAAPAKPALKPAPAKARSVGKSAAPAKPSAPVKAKAPAKAAPASVAAKADKKASTMEKPSKKNALRDSILKRKAASKPIAFSLDEVRAIAQTVTAKTAVPFPEKAAAKAAAKAAVSAALGKVKPSHVKAASLADILGFNPKKAKPVDLEEQEVPEKFKRYYKLLVNLRKHLTAGIELHSEATLKRSSKDDAGDLSAYGQHQADAGTDTFDRDFALSLVSSEQEALTEIDSAIKRIREGTYGVCEITQKAIAKERLLAVPFTRYSATAQKDLERNRHRARTQAGIFGELGEEGSGKMADDGGGDE